MALIRNIRILQTPPILAEYPNKIFLEGQAHDPATLTPRFNEAYDTIVNEWGYFLPLTTRVWKNYWTSNGAYTYTWRGTSCPTDLSLLDSGQGKLAYVYPTVNLANTLLVPPNNLNTTTKFINTQSYVSSNIGSALAISASNNATETSFIFAEIGSNVYFMTHAIGNQTQASTQVPVRISYVNSSTGAITTPYSYGTTAITGTLGTSALMTYAGASSTNAYFYNFNSTVAGTAPSHALYTFDLTSGVMTQRVTTTRTTTQGGTSYWPSHMVTTGTNTRAIFCGEYLASSGAQLGFVVTTFDVTTPTTAPTVTLVTPTGSTGMPGTMSNTGSVTYRTWAFTSGSNTYICVGAFDMSGPAAGTAGTGLFAIHTYMCATATPTSISYVNSVLLSATEVVKGIIPTDSTFATLMVPTATTIQFYSWNAASSNYIKASQVAITPSTIGIDQVGRIWATDGTTLQFYSPTISNNITVSFDSTNLTYTGTTLTPNVLVSAYNYAGARIATTVTLQIDSPTCTFADSTTTKVVTTLTTGELSVPLSITGSSYVRVIANLSI